MGKAGGWCSKPQCQRSVPWYHEHHGKGVRTAWPTGWETPEKRAEKRAALDAAHNRKGPCDEEQAE